MTDFKREMDRYIVLKRSDIDNVFSLEDKQTLMNLCEILEDYRKDEGKQPLRCVVVEDDWPEYETVWKMLEDRFTTGAIR